MGRSVVAVEMLLMLSSACIVGWFTTGVAAATSEGKHPPRPGSYYSAGSAEYCDERVRVCVSVCACVLGYDTIRYAILTRNQKLT